MGGSSATIRERQLESCHLGRYAHPDNRTAHVRVNGTQCGSPAIRGNRQCYFHSRHQLKPAQEGAFNFPTLEDANAIQVALMQVIRVIADNKIECKRAGLLLYALQTASYNLKRTKLEPDVEDIVLDTSSLQQEITPPPDPADAIRAMRRTYWKLHDPNLIKRDQEIVARWCSRATAPTPDSSAAVWPASPTRDSVPNAVPRNVADSVRGTGHSVLHSSPTRNSAPPAVPADVADSVPGTRYSVLPDSPLTTEDSQLTTANPIAESPGQVDPVLQFLAEMRLAYPPDTPTTESPDEDDEGVTPEERNIVKLLSLLTGPEDRTTLP
jgi:hypothetical protein